MKITDRDSLKHSQLEKVSLVGPSACMAPVLFEMGLHNISGYCATDQKLLDQAIRRGDVMAIYDAGYMVSIDRPF